MMLVTDAMSLAATEQTQMPFFDTKIIREGDKLTTPDGTLAGSCLTMDAAVRNTVNWCGISLADAVKMASETPANMLGLLGQYGVIAEGASADLLVLDDACNITHIWQRGVPAN